MVGTRSTVRRHRRRALDLRPVAVEAHLRTPIRRQLAGERGLRHHELRLRIRHHGGEPFRRIGRIERQIRAPSLEDAEQPDDRIKGALDADSNDHVRSDAAGAQVVGEAVGTGLELAVTELLVIELNRHRVRAARSLFGEQIVQAAIVRIGRCRRVPRDGQARTLGFGQQRNVQDPSVGISGCCFKQTLEVSCQPLDGGAIEQVRRIFDRAGEARRRLVYEQRQIEFRREVRALALLARDRKSRQRQSFEPGVLKSEADLKQRLTREVAFRLQDLDQLFERQILMRVSVKRRFPDTLEQLAECRIAGQIVTHDQEVDEHPGQILDFPARPAGDR